MKPILRFAAFVLLTGVLFYVSCKKEYPCRGCIGGNKPPIANAGSDQVITLPTDSVSLDGSLSSDPDGTISGYLWKKISGPASFIITNPSVVKTVVKNLAAGSYQFELNVTDNGGLSAKDTMRVIVIDPAQPNRPPVANAGPDQTITLPINSVNLDGTSSTDPDNNITSYAWTKISGPTSFNISNANAVQTLVTNLVQGAYQFELNVTDAGGLFSKDTMRVTVNPAMLANCGSLSQTLIGTLSIKRSSVSILTADNKILFAGGSTGPTGPPLYGYSPRVDIYDKTTQTWSTADLSMTRLHIGTIALGNKIYFAGGDNGNPCSRVDIYDASSNTWSIAELSVAREGIIAVAAGNKVLFAGGIGNIGQSNKVDIYDQSSGVWSVATLSQPMSGSYSGKYEIDRSGVISIGNKIYFITGDHTIDIYDALTNTWSILQPVTPNQLWGGRAIGIENKIYFSGISPATPSPGFANTSEVYNISTNGWSSANMLQPRSDMAAIGGDNKIFWAGGIDSSWVSDGEFYVRSINNIEIYDVNTGSHLFHNLLQDAFWVTTLKTSNKIFFSYGNYTEIYDMNNHSWTRCNILLNEALAIGNTVYQLRLDNSQVWKLEF